MFDENSWSYFGEYYDFVENLDMESLNPMLKDQEMIEEVFSKAEYTHFGIGFYKADNGYYYTFHLAGNESVDTKPEEKPEEKPNPKLTIEEAKKQILEIVNKERAKMEQVNLSLMIVYSQLQTLEQRKFQGYFHIQDQTAVLVLQFIQDLGL